MTDNSINEEIQPCPVYSFLGTLTTHTRDELCQVDLVRISGKQLPHHLLHHILKKSCPDGIQVFNQSTAAKGSAAADDKKR
jgi:hypothetical protein